MASSVYSEPTADVSPSRMLLLNLRFAALMALRTCSSVSSPSSCFGASGAPQLGAGDSSSWTFVDCSSGDDHPFAQYYRTLNVFKILDRIESEGSSNCRSPTLRVHSANSLLHHEFEVISASLICSLCFGS